MLVQDIAGLYIPQHDYVTMTYVASGNGVGEIETITYKQVEPVERRLPS